MKYKEQTPEHQEILRKELDPDNSDGILARFIRILYDDWETGLFNLDSGGLDDLARCCARYEDYALLGWDDDNLPLFQLEFCLFDTNGRYFDFFRDICNPAEVIMSTAYINHDPEHLYPHFMVDLEAAIEQIKKYIRDYLIPKPRTWEEDSEPLLLEICREVQKKYTGGMWREIFEADVKQLWNTRYPNKVMPPIEYDPLSGRLYYYDYERRMTE